ncbi:MULTISPECIES: phosphoadenylyl-sulfate reductase [Prauserella salsuginis group]|uniref:Adenosine 5'-phosphosulfate reductase n=2 Tax=Prauserella salsuginis group TaxID=2893672 RepID=A0A839XSA0_9PSEU|nr:MULTISPECIES: phosphoadenylyl-sulfate reductase [Prauserella salsuginis group]MBB3666060.1 phosphoadenosine phosphosulfate reductase [Prauserella sediminis]MCR3718952.1 phosphoadenosine phosphosulfate reductase [Prauserella flava]MCR3733522.1 phosphoadenosine phosphosulfate reductase [Prauserella salsuginis]
MTATRTAEELQALAERASGELAEATTEEAIRWAVEQFGDDLIVASNMQDALLVDVVTKVKSDIDVLFLETGYHFAETLGVRDAVATIYPDVRIVNAQAEQSVAEQDAEYGPKLHDRDPNQCCHLRKVVPLRNTLAEYSCWITGVRRVDAPTRANTPIVTWDDRNGLVKVNPIAAWTDDEFNGYIDEHGILQNPLVHEGYLSIGCAPCTAKVAPGADPRSGRWAGKSKTECGLHA